MPTETIVIEFQSNIEGLVKAEAAIDGVDAAGKNLATDFKKGSEAMNASMTNTAGNAEKLSTSLKDVSKNAQFNGAKDQLNKFGTEVNETVGKSQRLTTQLRAMKQQLSDLDSSGQAGSKAFQKLAKDAAKLEDQIGDTSARIRALASDTKNIDAVVGVVSGLAGAFSAAQGAAALLGGENEDLQKSLLKVQAAMALATGVQQVANTLQKESVVVLGLQRAAQTAFAVAVGTSTGVMRAFRIALAATGIGFAIIAVYELAANWDKLKLAINGSSQAEEDFADVQKKALKNYSEEKAQLSILLATAKDENLSRKTRQEAIKKLKEEYPTYLGFLTEENVSSEKTAIAVDKLNKALFVKAKLTAAEEKLVDLYKKQLELQTDLSQSAPTIVQSASNIIKSIGSIGAFVTSQVATSLDNQNKSIEEIQPQISQFESLVADLNKEMDDLGGNPNATIPKVTKEAAKLKIQIGELIIPFKNVVNQLDAIQKETESLTNESDDAVSRSLKKQLDAKFKAADDEKKLQQELFNTSIQLGNQLFSFGAAINAKRQADLDKRLKQGTISEKQYAKQVAEIKRKQAIAEKEAAAFNIIINTAIALSKVAAQTGILAPILGAAIATLGAVELATVLAQPIPAFAKGTEKVEGGTPGKDSVLAWLMPGERIVPTEINKQLGGIKNEDLPKLDFTPSLPNFDGIINTQNRWMQYGNRIDYDMLGKSVAKHMGKELQDMPRDVVNFDEKGVSKFIERGLSRTEIKSKRGNF